MERLSDHSASVFLERFANFHDSVIRKLYIDMTGGKNNFTLDIIISVKDNAHVPNIKWVNVHFQIRNVSEFCFREKHNVTQQVLSDGISIIFANDQIFLDFETCETTTTIEVRESPFYAGGKECYWIIEEYSEL